VTAAAKRQLALLVLLGIVLVGALQWQRTRTPVAEARPPARTSAPPASRGATPPVADLRLQQLHANNDEIVTPSRNPFRFQPKAPPPRAEVPVQAAPQPVVPTGPLPPPPIPLKFIGLLDAPQRIGRVAILSDSRGSVFYGKEGDIIDGRYQLLRIGTDSADLAYTDGRGRQALRLSGQ
jgi:hypothetical protein